MEKNIEVIKCIYNSERELIAFFRKDLSSRSLKLYLCKEADIEDIDQIFTLNNGLTEEEIKSSITIEDEKI